LEIFQTVIDSQFGLPYVRCVRCSDKIQIDLMATGRHLGVAGFMDERGKKEHEYMDTRRY